MAWLFRRPYAPLFDGERGVCLPLFDESPLTISLVLLFFVSVFFKVSVFLLFPFLRLLRMLFVIKELPFRGLALPWFLVESQTH